MRVRKIAQVVAVICFAAGLAYSQQSPAGNSPNAPTAATTSSPNPVSATPSQDSNTGTPTLRSEARIVRVDVIVTDKKGNYVHDLTASDFHVFDNDKEQKIINFTTGRAEASAGAADRHYMVLFFDDSTMDTGDQVRARQAAVKFIDANAGPDRVMAVVDFTGTLRILQNFSADAVKLRKATQYAQTSAVSPNSSDSDLSSPTQTSMTNTPLGPSLFDSQNDFGVYTLLLGIRSLAKNLANVPGRKSVILFTSGFPLTPEADAELTATISECNKANVAIYPMDVRGLIAPAPAPAGPGAMLLPDTHETNRLVARAATVPESVGVRPKLVLAAYRLPDPAAEPQHGGGGGPVGGGGGRPGGGAPIGGGGSPPSGGGGKPGGGSGPAPSPGSPGAPRSGSGGAGYTPLPYGYGYPPGTVPPQAIVPQLPDSGAGNQSVLYALADGTGGFPILNDNDLLGGLVKIANEQNEYYFLGYSPLDVADGSCHTLKVKVEHSLKVRARTGYCTAKPSDMLAGKPIEKDLEARASGNSATATNGSMEAPFFYTSPNEARVNVSLEIPSSSVDFDKEKGKYHADVNILGIAYRADGSVGARFSDQITLDFEKDVWKQFMQSPMRYQNQFDVAPGKYRLDVVLSAGGQNFGKYEAALDIDPYNGKTFSLSGLALSNQIEQAQGLGAGVTAALLQDQTPLVVGNYQLVPSGSNRFKKADVVALYAQVYDPSLAGPNPPAVRIAFRVVDAKTGHEVIPTEAVDATSFVEKGNPVVPLALNLPIQKLPSGSYRLDMQAYDMSGTLSKVRSVEFAEE